MKLNSSQVGESVRMCGSNPAPRCNYKEYSLGPFYLVENGCDSKYNEDEKPLCFRGGTEMNSAHTKHTTSQ